MEVKKDYELKRVNADLSMQLLCKVRERWGRMKGRRGRKKGGRREREYTKRRDRVDIDCLL